MRISVDTKTEPASSGTMAVSHEVKAEYDGARLLRVILRGGDIDGDPDTEIDNALADQVKALGADRKCFHGRLRAVLVVFAYSPEISTDIPQALAEVLAAERKAAEVPAPASTEFVGGATEAERTLTEKEIFDLTPERAARFVELLTAPSAITGDPKIVPMGVPLPLRRRLPADRHGVTHKIVLGEEGNSIDGFCTVNTFEDGTPGEIFLTLNKSGSLTRGLMDSIAILVSICLQHSIPLSTIAKNLTGTSFGPRGWTKNPKIKSASSVMDFLMKILLLQFPSSGEDVGDVDRGNKNETGA